MGAKGPCASTGCGCVKQPAGKSCTVGNSIQILTMGGGGGGGQKFRTLRLTPPVSPHLPYLGVSAPRHTVPRNQVNGLVMPKMSTVQKNKGA